MYNAIERYLNIYEESKVCGMNRICYISDMFPHEDDSIAVLYDGKIAHVFAYSIHPEYGGGLAFEETITDDTENYEQAIWNAIAKAFGMLLNRGW